jgi:cyclopropane-fatty-acyl-phospholipid synthase
MTLQATSAPDVTGEVRGERSWLDSLARRAVLGKLTQLRGGQIVLVDGSDRHRFGAVGEGLAEPIVVHVHDPRFYGDLAFGGSIGAGEAYVQGHWSTSQLVDLVRLLVLNMDVLDRLEDGYARLTAPLRKVLHAIRRNTRSGSRRNIAAHYDLGNEFFRLFLDETLMYSSAIFTRPDMSLHEAQLARLDLICRKLDLRPGERIVEIGTGWGGFALHAAQRYGCRVTTTTISQEQYRLARERVSQAGLDGQIEVVCTDYRDLRGSYDKLVSIEMIEAIGHQYFDTYFAQCSRLLKPHGAMLLQAITIADQRYESARRSVDLFAFGRGAERLDRTCQRYARVPPRRHRPALRADPARVATQPARQPAGDPRAGLRRRLHPHVGVLLLLLRGRLHRARDRRRADAAGQAR